VLKGKRKHLRVAFGLASLKTLGIGGTKKLGSRVEKARNRSMTAELKAISVQGVNESITYRAGSFTTAPALT
jgi:hypothetical protein